jgi:hypothetical protein
MSRAIEQLEAMRHLGENWDGYGAARPRAEAIDLAIEFLRHCKVILEPGIYKDYVAKAMIRSCLLGPRTACAIFNSKHRVSHGNCISN